jgi:hypothetical protein
VRRATARSERQPPYRGVLYELPYSIRQALVALAILGAGWVLYALICWLTECQAASSRQGSHQDRAGDQCQDRQGSRPDDPAVAAGGGGSGHRVETRQFVPDF